jgi:hypothetical protein
MSKNVADLRLNEPDSLDAPILAFYGRRPPVYAVYRTPERVLVQFADTKAEADDQRQKIARLNPLRGEINGLIDGWRSAEDGTTRKSRADRYDRRVGDALVVAFEGDVATAEELLKTIKADILAERVARGRLEYLTVAFAVGAAGLAILLLAWIFGTYENDGIDLLRAAAAGATGAFFSVSLTMRSRRVLPDLERTANLMDAALRMLIGLMAGAVLMALIRANIVNIGFGTNNAVGNEQSWLVVLIIGFIAGFSEQMVPDLLAKANASTDRDTPRPIPVPPPPPAPPSGANPAAADASEQPETDEPDALPEEAATDGCVSDLDLPDDLVTTDTQLPASAGGVERPAQPGVGG